MIEPRRPSWWITPALLLCVFAVLLWQVSSHGVVTRLDVHVRNGIQDAATSPGLHWLAPIGRACADLGDEEPAILFLFVVGLLATVRARTWRPLLIAAGAGIVLASVIPLKIWVGRPGPGQAVLGNANLGFFPSGHTADAMCCYLTAAFLLSAFVWTGPAARRELAACATAIVGLTIFGLLWSNYHWLSDVVGSLCWCGAWLLVLLRCADRVVRRERSPAEADMSAAG
jgi:membrane-associated phospholipid phosphatase